MSSDATPAPPSARAPEEFNPNRPYYVPGPSPWPLAGAFGGAVTLAGIVIAAHFGQLRALARRDHDSAAAHRRFYDEYNAVMDLPAEFFLETVERIFQQHALPRGELTWRGRCVRPQAITRTALLTVEGERDDICAIGQTAAALDMCSGIRVNMKQHHLQSGAGHYGVFAGRRWEREVYPRVREVIQVTESF